MCFFPRIFIILPSLPRKHWAAFGCTEISQPIGVTVRSHSVKSFGNLLQPYVGEEWVAVDNEKAQFFLHTLYIKRKDTYP